MRKKITFLIISQIHIRNYISTNALDFISIKHDCQFIVLDGLDLPKQFQAKHSIERITKIPFRNHWRLFEFLMFEKRSVSTTFRFRIKRLYFPNLANGESTLWGGVKNVLRRIKLFLIWLVYLFSTLPGISPLVLALLKARLERSEELEKKTLQHNPDIIVLPSSAYDPIGMEMVRIARKIQSKTMMIIDNWDNLSSKSVMYDLPDFLSVWGQQSIEHAVSIQGMPPERIFTLGTPRFDGYFKLRDQQLPNCFEFRYLLFVGTALEFDERGALEALDECISTNSALRGMKIVYRPHPWRQSKRKFVIDDLSNVLLDPQVEAAFQQGDKSQQPDLAYYPSLLQNAEAVVGGMTTMLIEALIMRTPYMALIWDDPDCITNMREVFSNYMHFRGTENLEALVFSKSSTDLPALLDELCRLKGKMDPSKLDDELSYFYDLQDKDFPQRFDSIISKIL